MDEIPSNIETHPSDQVAVSHPPGIDFLPFIWNAAEAFTSPVLEIRCEGFKRLVESDAVRNHPLVAYLLVTRITEPDIELRTRIVRALAGVILPADAAVPEDQPAYAGLESWLGALRTRQIYSLLQVMEFDKASEPWVAALLGYCSYAGEHLAEILADRQVPLSIRKQAAHFIGRIGYLDALPVLERMGTKLEQRRNGRESWGETVDESDECSLLPLIRDALTVLSAP